MRRFLRRALHAGTCISCGAIYGSGHYSWCKFATVTHHHSERAA